MRGSVIRAKLSVGRRSSLLRRLVAALRSRQVVRSYLRTRERYARAARASSSVVGIRPPHPDNRSGTLRAPGSRLTRLFCVLPLSETASPMLGELQREFDVSAFDLTPHLPRDPRAMTAARRARLQRDILSAFREAQATRPVDLAWMYVSAYHCEPETLDAIRSEGALVAVLSMDDKHAFDERPVGFPNGQRALIGAATVHLTTSIECTRWYAAEGASAYYFPEAADPLIFRKLDVPKDIDVSFVGGWYGARRELISDLNDVGIHVECFGPGTKNGTLGREEMVRVFNRSRVNLGFGGVGESADVTHLKGRDFEVPMSGNAYLTLFDHELAMHYRIGDEIACYRNAIDCAEQIRMMLEDPSRRERMAQAGHARAIAEHTWSLRMRRLLEWLETTPAHLDSR